MLIFLGLNRLDGDEVRLNDNFDRELEQMIMECCVDDEDYLERHQRQGRFFEFLLMY
jgi:hypothetical protein